MQTLASCLGSLRSKIGQWFLHLPLHAGTISAMLGAMILSQLISAGGHDSPAYITGYYLSNWLGRGYLGIAGFIGVLGTFISGSTMTANVTFGAIQQESAAVLAASGSYEVLASVV
eukprot:GHUV01030982.1.p2 GENE.GHUV01030982.1~~GHUV01030982.1.p2  ORF type:complete len:116 (+),score=8.59 GHUV01030982.1:235-582(+)